ncbi:MAG: acylphosphatase [Epsilonproteobacteria bacterium]|nr:acylphosphatase [Campylobacterota bacterium]
MKKCLKITVSGKVKGVGYREYAKKHATNLEIEGTAQNSDDDQQVIIYARGQADNLEKFIDHLYKGSTKSKVEDIFAEPFTQERDFRGVFRVIGQD